MRTFVVEDELRLATGRTRTRPELSHPIRRAL